MDIAYIYTWNRNEPMRFFYKINARVTIPIISNGGKHFPTLTDSMTPEASDISNTMEENTTLPPRVTAVSLSSPIVEITEEDKKKTVPELLKMSDKEESESIKIDQVSKTDMALKEPLVVRSDLNKKDRRSSPPPIAASTVPLNPPISPEGTSRKENISDNVRNNCANDSPKPTLSAGTTTEEKKSIDTVEQPRTDTTTDAPMKRLEKLIDQQQETSPTTITTTEATNITSAVNNTTTMATSPSALTLPKKPVSVGESKLNLSISKLIMKNQNASGATKFVPTLQQMQQIGMHTSIPSFQQQQQLSTLQPNAYIRPGFPGMHTFKRTSDMVPARSQAPTNRPPFIPVRKSYEWNKARTLAAKPLPPPGTTAVKDNKTNEKPSLIMAEKSTKKTTVDKTPTTANFSAKNLDEMNAAQSLLKVGQDLRHLKQPIIGNLHDKYNCESSLQITKVTEPETNQTPVTHEIHSNSQPSLQIMRVPTATEKLTKPNTVDTSNGNGNTGVSTNKPVNKKPVPSLYSMPTKRMKEDHHHNVNNDNKRIERRVDTENGVLSVSLLTETSKQDMDAKRREVVQPDVSIKLMTFATEAAKKTPELSPISTSGVNNKKRLEELNPISSVAGSVNKRKLDEVNSICGANKRKQDEPERKVTPPKPAPSKDDVPQLIEINSSPYAKLLPTKKQQQTPKQQPTIKQQSVPKQLPSPKQQAVPKQQPASKVLDLSKSPPNGGIKRLVATDGLGGVSPPNKKKTTSPVQSASSTMAAATSAATAAAINSNLLFAAQRQAAAFLLKQHFESLNNGLLRNGGKGPVEWPRAMFNPALFARPPTNLNN